MLYSMVFNMLNTVKIIKSTDCNIMIYTVI